MLPVAEDQLATSSEMSPFPPGLPEDLRSQIPDRMKKFYCVICKVFHFPLHSTASQGLHPSQPKTHSVSRKRPYSSPWPLAP